MTITFLLLLCLLFALAGAPLFAVIAAVAMLAFAAQGFEPVAVIIEMYRMANNPVLIAIPLFTFAGYLLAESNAPARIVRVTRAMFGWMPGGIAIVALLVCSFFTAFTGASSVTIVALGGLLFPILVKENYDENFSLGLLTASGSLGLLFPPSLPIILYAVISTTSVDQLFAAGILPGFLLIAGQSVYSSWRAKKSNVTRYKFQWKETFAALKAAAWEIPLPFIILFGIYGGFFTASEAAAITAGYLLIVEVFIHRDIHPFKDLPRITQECTVLLGGILLILGASLGLTSYLVDAQVPQHILESIQQIITSKWVFLIALNIFLLIVGAMIDIFSAIIVVVPLILPIAEQFGINPVHLGIIFLTNLEIGYSTPPVGLNLFISSFRFDRPVLTLYKATLPFLAIMLGVLLVITYWEGLSLFLVQLIFGGSAP